MRRLLLVTAVSALAILLAINSGGLIAFLGFVAFLVFVEVPLAAFGWVGAEDNILLFHAAARWSSIALVGVFYSICLAAAFVAAKHPRWSPVCYAIYVSLWVAGVAGLARLISRVAASI